MPKLAKQSLMLGGASPCILNAANEAAVGLFLNGKIRFTDIFDVVANAMDKIIVSSFKSYDDIVGTHEMTMQKILTDYSGFVKEY